MAINGRWGWQQEKVQLLPGKQVGVGPDATHRIELIDVQAPKDEATIEVNGRQNIILQYDQGTRRGRYSYRLSEPSIPLVSTSAYRDGQELALSEYAARIEPTNVLHFGFSEIENQETNYLFIIPDEALVVRLQWLNQQSIAIDERPHLHQWVFQQAGQTSVGDQEIKTTQAITETHIGDVTYKWTFSHYVVIEVNYQPGWWLFTFGTGSVLIGMIGHLIPRQHIWSKTSLQNEQVIVEIREESQGATYGWRQKWNHELNTLRAEIEGT
jgi:hypothetical protein